MCSTWKLVRAFCTGRGLGCLRARAAGVFFGLAFSSGLPSGFSSACSSAIRAGEARKARAMACLHMPGIDCAAGQVQPKPVTSCVAVSMVTRVRYTLLPDPRTSALTMASVPIWESSWMSRIPPLLAILKPRVTASG